jgi:hypothetical protein
MKPLFASGTQPTADVSAYPASDEVPNTYVDLRAKNLERLDEFGDAGLDRGLATRARLDFLGRIFDGKWARCSPASISGSSARRKG